MRISVEAGEGDLLSPLDYLRVEIGDDLPVWSLEGDLNAGWVMEAGKEAMRRLVERDYPNSGAVEELHQQIAEAQKAKDQLIMDHVRIALAYAGRYCNCRDPMFGDLVAVGMFSIVEHVGGYNPKFGVAFSTYITPYVWRDIGVCSNREKYGRRGVGKETLNLLRRYWRYGEGVNRTGIEPSEQEIMLALGITRAQLSNLRMAEKLYMTAVNSEDGGGDGEGDDQRWSDDDGYGVVHSDAEIDDDEYYYEIMALLADRLDILPKKVLLLHIEGWTLEEIGKRYRYTRERIRQILDTARKKVGPEILHKYGNDINLAEYGRSGKRRSYNNRGKSRAQRPRKES